LWQSDEQRIVTIRKAGPAEVEVLDVEPGDLGPPPARSEGQQHDALSRIASGVAGGP
jgi:hypothetical protein